MLKDVKGHMLVEIYVVIPNETYSLPQDLVQDVLKSSAHNEGVKSNIEGCYISVFDVDEGGL